MAVQVSLGLSYGLSSSLAANSLPIRLGLSPIRDGCDRKMECWVTYFIYLIEWIVWDPWQRVEPEEALLAAYKKWAHFCPIHMTLKTLCFLLLAAMQTKALHTVPTEMQFLASTEEWVPGENNRGASAWSKKMMNENSVLQATYLPSLKFSPNDLIAQVSTLWHMHRPPQDA